MKIIIPYNIFDNKNNINFQEKYEMSYKTKDKNIFLEDGFELDLEEIQHFGLKIDDEIFNLNIESIDTIIEREIDKRFAKYGSFKEVYVYFSLESYKVSKSDLNYYSIKLNVTEGMIGMKVFLSFATKSTIEHFKRSFKVDALEKIL